MCRGCTVRGGTSCYNPQHHFAASDVPQNFSHFRERYSKYLPVLPVALHKVRVYKTDKSQTVTDTGKTATLSHTLVGPLLRRELASKDFVQALKGVSYVSETQRHSRHRSLFPALSTVVLP